MFVVRQDQKQKDAQKYLFDNILRTLTNRKNKTSEITKLVYTE